MYVQWMYLVCVCVCVFTNILMLQATHWLKYIVATEDICHCLSVCIVMKWLSYITTYVCCMYIHIQTLESIAAL